MAKANLTPLPPRVKDIRGQRFGKLIVIDYTYNAGGKGTWRCQCDCGAITLVGRDKLISKHTVSCGAGRCRSRFVDITGLRAGSLIAVEFVGGPYSQWLCKCDCGKMVHREAKILKKGKWCSCGCKFNTWNKTHGKRNSKVYRAWRGVKSRCLNPLCASYDNYGARGITVCDRWLESFENFYADMGDPPSKRHSLDRINNDGNYEPGNCRWALPRVQTLNSSNTVWLTFDGRTQCLSDWAEEIGVGISTLQYRITHGWTVERALTTPVS